MCIVNNWEYKTEINYRPMESDGNRCVLSVFNQLVLLHVTAWREKAPLC